MKSTLEIPTNPIANLNDELKYASPVSIAIGHDNDLFILLAEERPPLINGCFPATVTEESYSYHIVHVKDGQKTVVHLPKEKWNYHYIRRSMMDIYCLSVRDRITMMRRILRKTQGCMMKMDFGSDRFV